MPKILITGNGFDLNLGLPTSYNDFIKILNFVRSSENLDFDSVFKNSGNYDKIIKNFKPFIIEKEDIKGLNTELSQNIWFDFFKNEYKIDTWIDFENRIEYVLLLIFKSFEYIKQNVFSQGSLPATFLKWGTDKFHGDEEIIQVLLKFGIISSKEGNRVTINKEYLVSRYNHYSDLDLEKITDFLYDELIQFKKIFNRYFEIFIIPFYDKLKITIDRKMYSMIKYHYTFNYTPTFDKLFATGKNTKFLHGKVDSISNKIVIGINDIPTKKVDPKYFLPFTKYFQKLDNDTDYVFLKELEKKDDITNYMFFFFGHSLDKSDKDYINEVFDFVNNLKSNVKKIIIIYHSNSSKSKSLLNLLYIRGKEDIEKLMRGDILIFRHIESEELKIDFQRKIPQARLIRSSVY